MRATVCVGYAYASAAFFYAVQDAFSLGIPFTMLSVGFVGGLVGATWWTRGER